MKYDADVIVVGAGIFGLSCAWACALRGMSVIIVEKSCVGAGASGGLMGAMSPNVPETWSPKKQFQLDALLGAPAYWQAVETASGLPSGYGRVGRLLPLTSEKDRAHAEIRAGDAKVLWKNAATWDVIAPDAYANWLTPAAAPFGAVHENLSARIAPRLACRALAQALKMQGCDIHEGWQVTGFDAHCVHGPSGRLRGRAIVLAAGADSFAFLKAAHGLPTGFGIKGQALMLGGIDAQNMPLIFGAGTYVIPHASGEVAVGSTTENTWDDPFETDQKLDDILEKALRICPSLRQGEIRHKWANLRPRGRKPDPILGPVNGVDGVFVATGGFKIGFGIAHKIGALLGAMIVGEDVDLPAQFYADHSLCND
ncbi:MAG: FAD-dependent oxidoreductase [Paracoccaceae bacterium]